MRNQRDNRQEELSNNTVNPALPAGSRNIPVARDVESIDEFGYPVLEENGAVRRNFVKAKGVGNGPGAWSYAMPGIIEGTSSDPKLFVCDNNGRADPNFQDFPRWQLPDTTKDVAPGTTGIIVAGSDLDEDRLVFHPDTNMGLRVNHDGPNRTVGESIVYGTDSLGQIDGNGGLSTAFYVYPLPAQMGGGHAIALNAMSLEDSLTDGNMAYVFNEASKYAASIGLRTIALGTWNRNGPFAADSTNQTEIGRNGKGEPVRAMMLDYRTAKYGNPEQTQIAPGPLDFDDSRYANNSTVKDITLSGISQGLRMSFPFFGKGRFYFNPNRKHKLFDADGKEYDGFGVWEIEVEEHIIAPQTTVGTPQGAVVKPAPSSGGQGGGGGGGGGGGKDNKGQPKGKPQGKPQGDVGKGNDNARNRKKCSSKNNRAGDGGNNEKKKDNGQPRDIGPRPPGVPPSIWRKIQNLVDRLAKAKAKGHDKRAARLAAALAALRAKAKSKQDAAADRKAQRERSKKYGTTNRDGQARVAGRRALARERARRKAACEPRMTAKQKLDYRKKNEKAAAKIIGGGGVPPDTLGSPAGTKPAGTKQKDSAPKGAVAGSNPTDDELLEKARAKALKELDEEDEEQKRAEEEAEGSKKRKIKAYRKRLKGRRKAIEDADWEGLRRQIHGHENDTERKKINQGIDQDAESERSPEDVAARKAAPKSMILPSLALDKIMQPGIDLYAVPEKLRRENATAAGDTRTVDEYIAQGKAPATISITPIAGFGIEPRNIKNLASISSTVIHAPDVDAASKDGSSVQSALILRPEVSLYIGAYAEEDVDADNKGPGTDGWRLQRGTDVLGNPTLDIDCLDGDGNHDPTKSVTVNNTLFDQNGDEIVGAPQLVPNSTVSQPAHGLAVGTPVFTDGTNYNAALGIIGLDADMVVTEVIDANNFKIANDGKLELTIGEWNARTGSAGGLDAGEKYYVDQTTPGGITATTPSADVMQYIGVAESATVMQLDIQPHTVQIKGNRHTIHNGETLTVESDEYYPVPTTFTVQAGGVVSVLTGGVLEAIN